MFLNKDYKDIFICNQYIIANRSILVYLNLLFTLYIA